MVQKRFRIKQLIRDHLLAKMQDQGIRLEEHILDSDAFIGELKQKLQIEAKEVQLAKDNHELTEELADVLEVIHALSRAANISLEQIEKVRHEKQVSKGSFDEKIYVSHVDIDESNPVIEYYLNKSDQYPLETLDNSSLNEREQNVSNCLFCQFVSQRERVFYQEFSHCYAIEDKYPVSKGHLLIIPKDHVENWFAAPKEVQLNMLEALDLLKDRLDKEYQPEGYNIGINCGEAAGQTVMHLHLHLIPRYLGDSDNPKGGVRGVIPSKQMYEDPT